MNDVNNAHKVKRHVVRILASLGIGMVVFGALGGAAYVFAIPPLSPYDPNETLDPTCAPGDTNCTVVTPVAGTGALGQIGFFSGTSTIASDSKFTFSSSTGDLGLVSDSAQFKLGALSDVGITRSVAGTLKITDGSAGLGSIYIGGMTFGTASGLLKATAGIVSTATTSDADFILPIQTGNSGKYLTTNGATSSWAIVPSSQWTTSGSNIYYNSGNVGIGNTNPLEKLHVSGGARIDDDTPNTTLVGYLSSSTLNVYNGNTTNNNYASIGFSSYFERTGIINMNGAPAAGMGAQFLSHVSASSFNFPTDLYFWTGYSAIGEGLGIPASEKMRITAAGNVGIGTSTPVGLLEVASSTSKTTLFTVLPNGNVGIGMTTADGLLTLSAATTTTITDLLINPAAKNAGNLIDAQVGGVSKFSVSNLGVSYLARSLNLASTIDVSGYGGWINMGNSNKIAWSNTSGYSGTLDTGISRYNAGTLAVGNGTAGNYSGSLLAGRVSIATTTTSTAVLTIGEATTTTITDLLINPSAKLAGNLIDAQVGGVSKFSVSNTGVITGAANFSVNASGYVSAYQVNSTSFVATNAAPLTSGAIYWNPTITNINSQTGLRLAPTYNQASGTASNTDLLINRTETAVGSGAQNLIDAQVGGVSKFSVTNTGKLYSTGSWYIGGDTGMQVASWGFSPGSGITTLGIVQPYRNISTATPAISLYSYDTSHAMTGGTGINQQFVSILPIYNQTSTAGATDLLINRTETAVGSGAQYLIDAQVGGVSKFSVTNNGLGTFSGLLSASAMKAPDFYGTKTANNVEGTAQRLGWQTYTNSSGIKVPIEIAPVYNQSGTAGATDLLINRTETAVGSGAQNLIDAQVGGVSKFSVTNLGRGYFANNVGIGTTTPMGLLEVASSTSKTTLFTVLPNGNVGIGTTTPAAKLEVVDAGLSTSIFASGVNNFQSFVMRKSDVANGIKDWIFQKREDTFFGGSAGSFIIYGDNYSGGGHSSYIAPIIFNTNGNILMAAASNATNGYVGIGTVSPAALLEVNSNIVTAYGAGLESRNNASGYIAGTSGFYPLASSVGNNDTVIKYAAGVNSFVIQHGTDKIMAIDQNGNVGIGTTTPSERLHIYDASDSTIVVGRAGAPTTLSEWSYNGGVVSFGSRASDAVQFIYNNAQKILLNGAGVSVSSGTNFNVDAGTFYVDSTYNMVGIATTSTTTSAVLTLGAATTTTLTDLLINPAAKNAGNLIDAQVGGVSKFSVTNAGSLTAVAVSASSGFFGTATTLNANYLRNGVSNSRTGDGYLLAITGAAARVNTSGNQQFFAILPSYNQTSGTASNTDLFINRTETAVGSGAQYLIDAQVGGVSKFSVTNLGRGYFADGISIATSSTSYGVIVGDGSTQKDVYIPKGGLCVDDDNAGCASTPTAGTIYAKATAITGIDVAEHYPSSDASLEPGDVVSFNTQNSTSIEKATASSTQYLAGVISTEPGVLLGKNIENARPVALNGRVPVKVSNENGAINIGDYLTASSQPGVAVKATSPGMTIGMALEAYNQSGVGKITVFVHTGFALGSSEAASDGEGGLITLLTRTFASIGITIENGITSIKQLIVDKITTKELCVEDLCLNKEQLKFILDRNGITIGSPILPQESLPPAPTPSVTASSTEEAIPTETPVKTPIETPVPTQAPPEPTASDIPPSPEPSASPSEQTQSPTETATSETPS